MQTMTVKLDSRTMIEHKQKCTDMMYVLIRTKRRKEEGGDAKEGYNSVCVCVCVWPREIYVRH